MEKIKEKICLLPVIIGVILILAGLIIRVPGGALTTYSSLDGKSADYYVFDDKYSSIDEYVGGDAYNYIIGATLVAGKISGTMATKAICIVGGLMCVCFGATTVLMQKKDPVKANAVSESAAAAEEAVGEPDTAVQNTDTAE